MAPEEIIEYLNAENRSILSENCSDEFFTHEQVLTLMDAAAMRGFRTGGESALSMVKSMLVMRQFRNGAANRN
ncbi:MAG TPA: hypothetical protein VF427_14545 [Noviherbaspirillum sp.]